ncbi:hypothetical protein GPECTOR_315g11 [Gonium pectorale]|uniref:Uncharacterized protein n=1 Tax=Gonium pectorale TaxID=33097 RepID=A0A150FVV7_GONPE|nr:hypothetical protein GPECTOR_315g11 [Gonium pectorale]|eukprot:KXZ41698.1 hypothetical protein GPECTOR_315g11 [Gonium pectorale]
MMSIWAHYRTRGAGLRSSDLSPTRNGGHAAAGSGQRGAPFPPVPRPSTSNGPSYLLTATRRTLPIGGSFDSSFFAGDASPAGSLPRLDSVSALPGGYSSGGGSGHLHHRGGGGGGGRQGRGHTASRALQEREREREREAGPAAASGGSSGGSGQAASAAAAAAAAVQQAPGGSITWAHVRDAQQHAWAESGTMFYRPPPYGIPQSHSLPEAQSSFNDPAAAGAAVALAAVQPGPPAGTWDESGGGGGSGGGAALAGGSSLLSLTYSNSYGYGNAAPGPLYGMPLPLPPPGPGSGYGRGNAGGYVPRVAYGMPVDLTELDRGLRDRERDLLSGFTRSNWSVGGPGTGSGAGAWERAAATSPLRNHRDRDPIGGAAAGSAAAGRPGV